MSKEEGTEKEREGLGSRRDTEERGADLEEARGSGEDGKLSNVTGHVVCFSESWPSTGRPVLTSSPVTDQPPVCDFQPTGSSCALASGSPLEKELYWLRSPDFGSCTIWEWAMLKQDVGAAMLRLGQGGGRVQSAAWWV